MIINPIPDWIREKVVSGLIINSIPIDMESSGQLMEIELLTPGWIPHMDIDGGRFLVDDKSIGLMINNFNARQTDVVFDYHHNTLIQGKESPASGWIKRLYQNNGALWASVEWTSRAQELMQAKEYRYHSPVVLVRKSDKRAVYIHSAALTNDPNIHGLRPLVNSIFLKGDDEQVDLIAQIKKSLGLPEDATDQQVMDAIQDLKKESKESEEEVAANSTMKAIRGILNLDEKASLSEVKAEIMVLKNSGQVPLERLEQLEKQVKEKQTTELLETALNSGKITRDMVEWARKQIESDSEAFQLYLNKAPQIVPLDKINVNKEPENLLDDTQKAVNSMMGITDEVFNKYNS